MSDLRAAAERVRKAQQDESLMRIYTPERFDWEEACGLYRSDNILLARAYLASHPPDSETEIDEAWLRAVGFRDDDDGGYLWINSASQDFDLQYWRSTEGFCFANERGDIEVAITTRSVLRGLCRVLGIQLKEEQHNG